MYCGHCGKQIDDNAVFCPACGAKVLLEACAAQPKKKKGRKRLVLGGAAVIAVCAVIVGAVQLGTRLSGESRPQEMEEATTEVLLEVKDVEYTDESAVNNFLRSNWQCGETFVYDDKNVYFGCGEYFYIFDKTTGEVSVRQCTDAGSYSRGIIIDEILYSNNGPMYSCESETGTIDFDTYWELGDTTLEEDTCYMSNQTLPYKHGYVYLCDSIVLYSDIDDIEILVHEDGIVQLTVIKSQTIFDSLEVSNFSIYKEYIIIECFDNSIWSVNLTTGDTVCLFKEQYSTSMAAVKDGFVYRANEESNQLERIKFDGSGYETDLFDFGQSTPWGKYLYNFVDENLVFVKRNGPMFESQYSICCARADNPSAPVVLAQGAEDGVDEWICELYVIDGWVYYGSQSCGYWRAKMDGSAVEKIADYSTIEDNEDMTVTEGTTTTIESEEKYYESYSYVY